MDVVGTMAMARALLKHGAMVALHKHYSADDLIAFFKEETSANAFYSLGTTESDHDKLKAVNAKSPISKICLDVANGYTEKFVDTVKAVRADFPDAAIMAGNVVTGDMTEALLLAGADIVKVGIGPGSVCTTRKMTGWAIPQLSAIIECADAAHGLKGLVCGDGGCTCRAISRKPSARVRISSCWAACSPATTNARASSVTRSATASGLRSA